MNLMKVLNDYLEKYPEHRKSILNFYAWFIQDLKKGVDEEDATEQLLDNLKFIDTYGEFNRNHGE